ncbi:ATP-binding protein [Actinoplanes sp. NPDC051861]|uniref:sensor histidine kinase n=1 Tax=Actinoplanes sp. NPDC051861 TaxID=3155170 RepID=UPI003417A96E
MRLGHFGHARLWRFFALPTVVWLVLVLVGTGGLVWLERSNRKNLAAEMRRVASFATSYVTDLTQRERAQAEAFLAEPVVDEKDFDRVVAAFNHDAAVLLDENGRVLHIAPHRPEILGQDLAARYPHLETAIGEGRVALSPVVASAGTGVPTVSFAVPFETERGRRVFSGAVEIQNTPLGAYLSTVAPASGAKVYLLDTTGAIVASDHELDQDLARAVAGAAEGRYDHGGRTWQFASQPVARTPWRVVTTAPMELSQAQLGGRRAALVAAAVVGLFVVLAAGRSRRDRRELAASEERFRKMFDGARVAMTLSDTTGRLILVNGAMRQMLGRTDDELEGFGYGNFVHPDDRDIGAGKLRDCLAGVIDGFDIDKRFVHAEGDEVETEITIALLRDDQRRPQYLVSQILDVTVRRALERARRKHEDELSERAEQLQQATDFIAMLTHDVRQPLSGVVSRGEVLLDDWAGIEEETKQRYVRQMTAAGHRADHILTEILTLAQLDAGAIKARPAHLDVRDVVREAVNASEVAFQVTVPEEAPGFADPVHLQLILGNLMSNAVKYGEPPFEIAVESLPGAVEVHVCDHGEGVPEGFVPHLFDRFARADSGVATAKPGTGLGLHFVRQLAEAGGVTVGYRPREPHGAVFVMKVPVAGGEAG